MITFRELFERKTSKKRKNMKKRARGKKTKSKIKMNRKASGILAKYIKKNIKTLRKGK